MPKDTRKYLHRVPDEFICPISKQFMKDPVIVPSTKKTYDRQSLVSLRNGEIKIDDNDILPPENEAVLPDHDLRRKIAAWRREYTLAPPFYFISTPTDLEAAINSLLDRQQHQLEDGKLLEFLCELKSAIQGKSAIVNSKESYQLLSRLIAGCPLESTSDLSQWVQISVGILANANNKNKLDLGDYQHKMLAVLDRVSTDIRGEAFQMGLVNLIRSLMASKEQIISNRGLVRALSSYVLKPENHPFGCKAHFDRLYYVILELWGTAGALAHPRLSQAVASLVWPMHRRMNGDQYHHLLQTIYSRLKSQVDGQTLPSSLPMPLEAMSRSGLVSRIFNVLEYTTLPQAVKQTNLDGWLQRGELTSPEDEELVLMRCFELLEYLSMNGVGRLEIVRVTSLNVYKHLLSFYSSLSRKILPRLMDSHVVPALSMVFNVLQYTRYTSLMEKVRGPGYEIFENLVDNGHAKVNAKANQIFDLYNKIRIEEQDPPPQVY